MMLIDKAINAGAHTIHVAFQQLSGFFLRNTLSTVTGKVLIGEEHYPQYKHFVTIVLLAVLGGLLLSSVLRVVLGEIALWDAAACCEREGSLDSNMRDITYNDFDYHKTLSSSA